MTMSSSTSTKTPSAFKSTGKASTRTPASKTAVKTALPTSVPSAKGTDAAKRRDAEATARFDAAHPNTSGTRTDSGNAVAAGGSVDDKSGPPFTGEGNKVAGNLKAAKAAVAEHTKARESAAKTGAALADPVNVTTARDQRRPGGGPENTEPGQVPDKILLEGGHKTPLELRRAKSDDKYTYEDADNAVAALEELVSFGPGTTLEVTASDIRIKMPNNRSAHGATWQEAFTDLWRIQAGGL